MTRPNSALVCEGRARGFSLIELLVVLAVLGVLAAAVLPLAEISNQRDRERELKTALWDIRTAIDAYKKAVDAGSIASTPGASGYPPTLQALTQGAPDAKAPGRVLYFLRRVPADPFQPPNMPAADTWGLRSYESPADGPKPGEDVHDVYSRSSMIGLNGVPLLG